MLKYNINTCSDDGRLYVWGYIRANNAVIETPKQITIPDVTVANVFAGVDYIMALATSGAIYAWGDNTFGQLGGIYVYKY
jgi:alpha-tubulin suppressor-like RCC1 family protein